jgi:ATP synthase protein I
MSVDGKPSPKPHGDLTPEDRDALERRSSELGRKLDEARQTGIGRRPSTSATGRNGALGHGMRLSAELVGGIVAGGAIGWYLDSWLHTKPWLFILFFLLGTAAGMRNLIVAATKTKTPPLTSEPDARDETK